MKKAQARHLVGSKWTDLAPRRRDKHFVVTRVGTKKGEASGTGTIELQALISKRIRIVASDEFDDTARWLPDWR